MLELHVFYALHTDSCAVVKSWTIRVSCLWALQVTAGLTASHVMTTAIVELMCRMLLGCQVLLWTACSGQGVYAKCLGPVTVLCL